MNLKIFIPTYKRVDRQVTWDRFPPSIRKHTQLVVSHEEAPVHHGANRNYVVSPRQGLGMAAIRGWIMRHAVVNKYKKIVILDDDLILQRRRPDGRITDLLAGEYEQAFGWMERTLDKVAHCAMGMRFLAWNSKEEYFECSRGMQVLGYSVAAVKASGAMFDMGVPPWFPMDDFHMTLQLLELGYPNRVSLEWRAAPRAANFRGGCSEQRTSARQAEAAELLQSLHPNFVKVVDKKPWAGMAGPTKDVSVRWKNAYKSSQEI